MSTLPNILLLTYQAEYENTEITIDKLCIKYDVKQTQLKNRNSWVKKSKEADGIVDTLDTTDIIVIPETPETPAIIDTPREELLANVETFKQAAMKEAVRWIGGDAKFAEVKEFKDMVAIVDSIEKSYKDTKDNQGTTINMVVQNMITKFQDDC